MTTSFIARNPHIPEGGLRQSMLRFATPLQAKDVVNNLATDRYAKDISV